MAKLCWSISRSQFITLFLLFLLGLFLRLPLLDPPSLWLDDLWASAVVKTTNLNDYFLVTSVTPIFSSLLTKIVGSIVPDKEIGPQLFPFFISCLSIPLLFLVVTKATNSFGAGIISALLLAFNPVAITYASRVKPYSGDILVSIGYMYFAVSLLLFPSQFSTKKFTLFCVFSSLLSQTSLIVGAAFYLNWMMFLLVNKKREDFRSFALSSGFFGIFISLYYWFALRHQINSLAVDFWHDFYIPIMEPFKAIIFLAEKSPMIFQDALDMNIYFLITLLVISFILYAKKVETRFLVFFYFFLYLIVISLSALKLYPMSSGRIALYLLPFNIFFLSSGFQLAEKALSINGRRMALFLCAAYFFSQHQSLNLKYPNNEYPVANIKPLVKILEKKSLPDDAIVCWSHSNWGLGYYTNWETRFVQTNQFANSFVYELKRPNSFTLNDESLLHGENVLALINIAKNYKRIWFISSNDSRAENLSRIFTQMRFSLRRNYKLEGCFLRLYQI